MRKLRAYNFLSLDGYYTSKDGDTSWHVHDAEEAAYAAESLSVRDVLVFGRKTYEMMASFWPTEMAMKQMPDVARGMNDSAKIVFSKTMPSAAWQHTTVLTDLIADMKRLKQEDGADMTVLGSGSVIAQLAAARLIDEYQFMIDPVVLGAGRSPFQGLPEIQRLKLTESRQFSSGVVLLSYHST